MPEGTIVRPAHLWVPEAAISSSGGEAADLAEMAGMHLDPEQRLAVDAILSERADGTWAGIDSAIICPRQNMKTFILKAIALSDLFLFDARLVIWSAHLFPTAQEAFRDLENIISGTPEFSRRVKRIDRANGEEGIELVGDRRLKFKARSKTGGRGLTGDRVILDEAFAIGPSEIGSLYPTLSARPNPSVVYASSAGMLGSAVLRSLRDRGRKGGDDSLVWVEWCARPGECKTDQCNHRPGTEGCILDDHERWIEANPAAHPGPRQRITIRYLESERRTLPAEEFMRERLGWWEDPVSGESGISQEIWAARGDRNAVITEPCTLALDVAPGHTAGAILTCGGALHVVDHSPGTSWIIPRLLELNKAHDVAAIGLDPSSPAGALIPDLEKAGFTVRHPSTNPNGKLVLLAGRESVQACEAFLSSVLDGTLTHRDEIALNAAVEGAGRREVGDSWKWSRKDSTVDICPLIAATIARYLWVTMPEKKSTELMAAWA